MFGGLSTLWSQQPMSSTATPLKEKFMNIFKKILKELAESKIEVMPDDPKDQEVANQMTQMLRHEIKTNEQILDEMCFLDDQGKPIKNYSLSEMIGMGKAVKSNREQFEE